ncbi:hypothetical protein L6452_10564 [Arctium lappa]|uniref:Uncharacterized protein n=1 Tax=Arctium lappa TaxID=4217 RepID=A0ACB9DMT4_ARCLA|nr:hypothetical protein L6452_10564 [Arctium lappa]
MVEPYDMEYMKMALLRHEETFKQQVYELHRLYEIQRMLMKKMQSSMQSTSWNLKNGNYIYDQKQDDDVQKQDGDHAYYNDHQQQMCGDDDDDDEMEEESEIELTLGPTTRYSRKKKKATSSGLGMFSSSSSSSSTTHKTRLITLQNSGGVVLESCRSTPCS